MQMASLRRGTHSTKIVSEVRGSGKKPYKQKGTGRARHGRTRAMNMRGGGIVHGPRPRDYSYRIPKKMVDVALRSALSLRLQQQSLFVVRGWSLGRPKTKAALSVLDRLEVVKALVVGGVEDSYLSLSLRNLPHAKFLPSEQLNVYDILDHDCLLVLEPAVQTIVDRLKTPLSRKERALREEVATA